MNSKYLKSSILCPVMVGREAYLEILGAMLDGTTRSESSVVGVTGEAGVGKTRLVEEVKKRAANLNIRVLQGNCFENDLTFPFAPIINLIRNHVFSDTTTRLTELLASPDLAQLFPEYATLPTANPTGFEQGRSRQHLFHALLQVFVQLATGQPLLIVLEDLHWSDNTSLEFVLYLARFLPTFGAVLLLTYRNDEINTDLHHTLAELERYRQIVELSLQPLAAPQTETMLQAIFDLRRPVNRDFLEAITVLTEGNPFFIEEILKSLSIEGAILFGDVLQRPVGKLKIPRTVQDALNRRVTHLSQEARQTLTLAAVTGRRFDLSVLQALTGYSEESLFHFIRELISAQLLVEDAAGNLSFRHALTQQAIYNGLLGRERQNLHARVALILEKLIEGQAEANPTELAYHFYRAKNWPQTLKYARQAGEKALTLYTPKAAVEQFTHALEAARYSNDAETPGLYLTRSTAYSRLGEFELALADLQSALVSSKKNQDTASEWQGWVSLAFLWSSRNYDEMYRCLDQALQLAHASGNENSLASSLNLLGNWYMNQEQPLAALERHRQALAYFEKLGNLPEIATTTGFIAISQVFSGNLVDAADNFGRAILLHEKLDNQPGKFTYQILTGLCVPYWLLDNFQPAVLSEQKVIEGVESGVKFFRDKGWPNDEAFGLFLLTNSLATRGRYGEALENLDRCMDLFEKSNHREYMAGSRHTRSNLLLNLFAVDEAGQLAEEGLEIARETSAMHWINHCVAALASTYLAQDRLSAAEQLLDSFYPMGSPAVTPGQSLCWRARLELLIALQKNKEALALLNVFMSATPNIAAGPPVPRLALLKGVILAKLGQLFEAEISLKAAAQVAHKQGYLPLFWRIEKELAGVLRAQNKVSEAVLHLASARKTIKELAGNISNPALQQTFLSGALGLLEGSLAPKPKVTKSKPGGLTGREQEVAALVATGLTNRQIADKLVLSEETVTVHVKHMLNKLGFTSRAQIAVWAAQNKLL